MELIDDDVAPGGNTPEFTVSELSGAIRRVVEGGFGRVRVRGEVGRVMIARSGHVYFDIKDDRSVLASVVWKGQVNGLETMPEEGAEVVASGKLTTFGSQSRYQLTVDDLRPAGMGALMAMLEKRRAVFAAEGLFDAARKRALPYLPQVIGVITSPQGAVIRDILHRLRDRFPRHVLVWPVAVQGKACAPEVARAIAGFNAMPADGPIPRPDLLIVARGGGSVEDLWGFNEEAVIRAAASGTIPLISAVGHETDTTLLDHVADRRAPTPTAAAEMAVPVRLDLVSVVDDNAARLTRALARTLDLRVQRLADLSRAMPRAGSLTANARQRLDISERALDATLRQVLAVRRGTLDRQAAVLRPTVLAQSIVAQDRAIAALMERTAPAMRRVLASREQAVVASARALSAGLRRGVVARRSALDQRRVVLRPHAALGAIAARDRAVTALAARSAPAMRRIVAHRAAALRASERGLQSGVRLRLAARRADLAQRRAGLRPGALQPGLAARRVAMTALDARARTAMAQQWSRPSGVLSDLGDRLQGRTIRRANVDRTHALQRLASRIEGAIEYRLAEAARRLLALDRLRQTLGYTATLERGFAVVRSGGVVVTTKAQASGATDLDVEFRDGVMALNPRPRKPAKPRPGISGQGTLL